MKARAKGISDLSSPFSPQVLIPNHIARAAAGVQQVAVTIAIHVHGAKVIALLVVVQGMNGEFPFAVVFIPADPLALVTAGCGIGVAVPVVIKNGQAVRLTNLGVDLMDLPARVFNWANRSSSGSSLSVTLRGCFLRSVIFS